MIQNSTSILTMILTMRAVFDKEKTLWTLLQYLGIAIIYLAIRIFMNKRQSRPLCLRRSSSSHSVSSHDLSIQSLMLSTHCEQLLYPSDDLDINNNADSCDSSAWACMGKITSLSDLDYRAVKPLRIYKFSPSYFLTMGGWICSRAARASASVLTLR